MFFVNISKIKRYTRLKSIISSNFMLMNDMKSLKTIDYYVQIILLKCVEIIDWLLILETTIKFSG